MDLFQHFSTLIVPVSLSMPQQCKLTKLSINPIETSQTSHTLSSELHNALWISHWPRAPLTVRKAQVLYHVEADVCRLHFSTYAESPCLRRFILRIYWFLPVHLSRQDNEKVEHDRNAETTKEGRGPISDGLAEKAEERGGFRRERGERFNNFQQRDLSGCCDL